MYGTVFLSLLKSHLKICNLLKCIPFEFDQRSGRLRKIKSARVLRIFRLQCVLAVMYCSAMFISIGPLTMSGRLQGFALFILSLAGSISRWNYSIDIDPIQIINAFLDFEAVVRVNQRFMRHFVRCLGFVKIFDLKFEKAGNFYQAVGLVDLPKIPISMETKALKIFVYLVESGVFSYPSLVFLLYDAPTHTGRFPPVSSLTLPST
ncbi:hypothetical protein Fcan01_11608 [Folsomia candida]|uniref:Uncharacterized protein n=1 Tax=Folsomia candida TaxID=158441 RepID=A0A226EAA5_FOLCA|nr:hypothetical protein Fcan01_11608 [Folsomia candida]